MGQCPNALKEVEPSALQAELGRRIGQRQTFVCKFELGERRLDAAEFIKVGKAIGADPYKIMRDAEGA